jgi:hypothetical protein
VTRLAPNAAIAMLVDVPTRGAWSPPRVMRGARLRPVPGRDAPYGAPVAVSRLSGALGMRLRAVRLSAFGQLGPADSANEEGRLTSPGATCRDDDLSYRSRRTLTSSEKRSPLKNSRLVTRTPSGVALTPDLASDGTTRVPAMVHHPSDVRGECVHNPGRGRLRGACCGNGLRRIKEHAGRAFVGSSAALRGRERELPLLLFVR